jgi:hypothetical protein
MKRFETCAAGALSLLLAAATLPDEATLADAVPVPDVELAAQRGGFEWQGMQINFGADVRTYLDGELVLQTIVNWTDHAETSQFVSGVLTPAAADQLVAGVLGTGAITMRVGDASVFLANGGQTALIHQVDGPVQNILINTASNTAIRQEVDAQLDIRNFDGFGAAMAQSHLTAQIQSMLDFGAVGGFGH